MYACFFLCALLAGLNYAQAAPSDKPKTYPTIVVEPDQTDIFAIPLDEDADEQQQELYNLEHPKK